MPLGLDLTDVRKPAPAGRPGLGLDLTPARAPSGPGLGLDIPKKSYSTRLNPQEESSFQGWVKEKKVPFDPSPQADYDMRGFWKGLQSGDKRAKTAVNQSDGRMHFPDTWKTPNHKTFSNESIYATPDAPHWEGDRLIGKDGTVISDESPAPRIPNQPIIRAQAERDIPKTPEQIIRAQDFEREVAQTPLPKPDWQKKQELLDKILKKAPAAMVTAVAPYSGLIYEGIQQLKNLVVSGINGNKYDPLESRQISEALPESTPEPIKIGSSIAETLTDIGLLAKLQDYAGRRVLGKTLETVGTKLVEAGHPKPEVEKFLNQVHEAAQSQRLSPESEIPRLIKARNMEIPVVPERQIDAPTPPFQGFREGIPPPASPEAPPATPGAVQSPPPAVQPPSISPESMPDANTAAAIARRFGDQAPFYVPGVGPETGSMRLAVVSDKLSKAFGVTGYQVTEAMTRAAQGFQNSVAAGTPPEHAIRVANAQFWTAMPTQHAIESVGLFKDKPEMLPQVVEALKMGDVTMSQTFIEALATADPELGGVLPAVAQNIQARQLTGQPEAAVAVTEPRSPADLVNPLVNAPETVTPPVLAERSPAVEAEPSPEELQKIRDEVNSGEAGQRNFVRDPGGFAGAGQIEKVTAIPSTFPEYFKNKGLTKAAVLNIIDKKVSGQPITEKQAEVLKDLVRERRFLESESTARLDKEELAETPEVTVGNLPLKEGDKFQFVEAGEVHDAKVEKVEPSGDIRIKDDPSRTLDVFDQLKVIEPDKLGSAAPIKTDVASQDSSWEQSASYNDLVRATYKGTESRRKINDLSPSLRNDVMGFYKSGIKPTPKNIEKWLGENGTIGYVEPTIKEIIKYQSDAVAVLREGEALQELNEREKNPKTESTPQGGEQTLIPGTPSREMPSKAVEPKRPQVEERSLLEGFKPEVEQPALNFTEPKIKDGKVNLGSGGYIRIGELLTLKAKIKTYFSTTRGVGKTVDALNDARLGKIMETAFDAPGTGQEVLAYLKNNPSKTLETAVYNFLTGTGDIGLIPQDLRATVIKMRSDVDSLSKMVSKYGTNSEGIRQVIEKNLGKYLTRSYRLFESKKFRPSDEVITKAKAKLRQMHPRTLGKLSEEEMDGVIENILDKGSAGLFRGERRIDIPQNHFIKRKNIPKEIRDLYGEITDPVYAYLKTVSDMATIAYNGEFLDRISQIPGAFSKTPNKVQFKRLPEGKRWGKVSGLYVDEDMHSFLIQQLDPVESPLFRFIEKWITNPFKATKTVYSIPSHPRNFLGNIMFSMLMKNNILNPVNAPYYAKALKIMLHKKIQYRDEWKELIRMRIVGTQYWGSEMPTLMKDLLTDPMEKPGAIYNIPKKGMDWIGEMYNNEDLIYRIAAYLKYKAQGMTPEQAASEVEKYTTNYEKLPKVSQAIRKTSMFGPFFSFKSNVIRIVYNAANEGVKEAKQRNPTRIATLLFALGLPAMISTLSKSIFDVDDDETEKLNKVMPVYRRNANLVYYRDEDGRLKAFDMTFLWPTGDFERAARSLIAGDVKAFADGLQLFAHPLYDAYSILFENINPYYKKAVSDPNDPIPQQMFDRAAELLKAIYLPASSPIPDLEAVQKGEVRPGLLTGYQIKNLFDAYNRIADKYGRQKELPEEVKNFLTGVRTWTVYPDILVQNYVAGKRYELNDSRRKLRTWMRNNPTARQSEKHDQMKKFQERAATINKDIAEAMSINTRKLDGK